MVSVPKQMHSFVLGEGIFEAGQVKKFYPKTSVAAVNLTVPLSVGDRILIKGKTSNFEQVVESMQIEHDNVQRCAGGQCVGLKVTHRVREHDVVYKKM